MLFDSTLPISWYREIADLKKEHMVSLVQHRETGKIYVKKVLHVYDVNVYELLFRHPVLCIPRIYAAYDSGSELTLIEEYISGETLAEILELCGTLSKEDAVRYTQKLCNILKELHSFQPAIIHRDIKPSNVMITEDDRVILLDLNAAKQATPEKSHDTRLIGTAGYAAPEQYGFGTSTVETDIYAVGILLQTMLEKADQTGKLQRIIQRCCQMDPAKRYRNDNQLLRALKKV